MKKIENWLLLPVLVLFCWSLVAYHYTLDIHLHDTYFILEGASTMRILAGYLLIMYGLYKTIRNRHQTINRIFAVSHILISLFFTGLLLLPFTREVRYIDYSNWNSYQSKLNMGAIAIIFYLLTQVIFLIYFIAQLIKKPVIRRQ
jgi:hypothetical protein